MASHATGPLAILLEPARAGKKLFGDRATQLTESGSDMGFLIYHVYVLLWFIMRIIPVVPHKAVAEVSKIGKLQERLVAVNHGWQSESTDGPPKGGWNCVFWSGRNCCSGHLTTSSALVIAVVAVVVVVVVVVGAVVAVVAVVEEVVAVVAAVVAAVVVVVIIVVVVAVAVVQLV